MYLARRVAFEVLTLLHGVTITVAVRVAIEVGRKDAARVGIDIGIGSKPYNIIAAM